MSSLPPSFLFVSPSPSPSLSLSPFPSHSPSTLVWLCVCMSVCVCVCLVKAREHAIAAVLNKVVRFNVAITEAHAYSSRRHYKQSV